MVITQLQCMTSLAPNFPKRINNKLLECENLIYYNLKFSHCIKGIDTKFKQHAFADEVYKEVKPLNGRTNCLRTCRMHESDKSAKWFAQSETILLLIKSIFFSSAQFKN